MLISFLHTMAVRHVKRIYPSVNHLQTDLQQLHRVFPLQFGQYIQSI